MPISLYVFHIPRILLALAYTELYINNTGMTTLATNMPEYYTGLAHDQRNVHTGPDITLRNYIQICLYQTKQDVSMTIWSG